MTADSQRAYRDRLRGGPPRQPSAARMFAGGVDNGNGMWLDLPMNEAPRILGISDEVTTCDHCGKADLARTVALDFGGDVSFYGTTCAARAFFPKSTGADIARSAAKRCACGCGEFGTVGTANGKIWFRPCFDRMRRAAA